MQVSGVRPQVQGSPDQDAADSSRFPLAQAQRNQDVGVKPVRLPRSAASTRSGVRRHCFLLFAQEGDAALQRAQADPKQAFLRHNRSPLDHVAQLPHIAGPIIRMKQVQRFSLRI